jgi:hypothetical protein
MKKILIGTFIAFAIAGFFIAQTEAQISVTGGQSVVLASLAAPYTIGDLAAASSTTALSLINDIAVGNVLLSGGVGTLPAYGKVALTTHVSGILPVANGGTGLTTATYGAATPASSTGFGTGVAGVVEAGSTDFGGRVTIGTGGDTVGTVTLGGTYTVKPHCIANNETAVAAIKVSASTTILTFGGTFTAADKITWVCR